MIPRLDSTFAALADPTRRALLARLAREEATVMELAQPFAMSQPAISRHLKVLEEAGLILRRVEGTKRPCRLAPDGVAAIDQWLDMLRQALSRNYDRLDAVLAGMTATQKPATQKKENAMSNKMTLVTEGDRHVVVTRRFAAAPELVWRAHTEPSLIQKWILGPDGWTMPVCICDAKPGGKIRYEWSNGQGGGFSLTGEFVSLTPFSRIEHVERMHLPATTPDNRIVTSFMSDNDGNGDGTMMTMRMELPNEAARTAMLASGMDQGMEISYARLENMIQAGTL